MSRLPHGILKKYWGCNMRRKIFCLILALMLLPSMFIFEACKKKETYNLDNMYTDYAKIFDQYDNIELSSTDQIQFVYDDTLQSAINDTAPYTKIREFYYPLLKNSTTFVTDYIKNLSRDKFTKDNDIKLELKSDLEALDLALSKINTSIESVEFGVKQAAPGHLSIVDPIFLHRLEGLFYNYEELYEAYLNLHDDLATLYYNYAYSTPNPNYYEQGVSNFDVAGLLINLKSRQSYHIVNLTRIYIEMNVDGANLSNKFIDTRSGSFAQRPENFTSYQEEINNVSMVYETAKAETINENADKKNELFELAVKYYNVQSLLDADYKKYRTAIDEIRYGALLGQDGNTAKEEICLDLVRSYNQLLGEYSTALINIFSFTNRA